MRNLLLLTFIAALTIAAACGSAAPVKIEKAPTSNTGPVAAKHDEHSDDAKRITLADAKKDFDAGTAVFVDTRAEDAYKVEHIKGSVRLGSDNFAANYKDLPKDKKIIAYCS